MDSVAFLQQQINEITQQIKQLEDKRAELRMQLYSVTMLQRNNLKIPSDLV